MQPLAETSAVQLVRPYPAGRMTRDTPSPPPSRPCSSAPHACGGPGGVMASTHHNSGSYGPDPSSEVVIALGSNQVRQGSNHTQRTRFADAPPCMRRALVMCHGGRELYPWPPAPGSARRATPWHAAHHRTTAKRPLRQPQAWPALTRAPRPSQSPPGQQG